MRSIELGRIGLVTAMLVLVVSTDAQAQLGRLKDAAKQAVTSSAPVAAKSAPDPNVVAITDTLLDGVVVILDIEEEMRVLETQREALNERDDSLKRAFDECNESQKRSQQASIDDILARIKRAEATGDWKAMQVIGDSMAAVQGRIMAAAHAKCGATAPSKTTYSDRSRVLHERRVAALRDAGLTHLQYQVVVERVTPFCAMVHKNGGQPVQQVPGESRRLFYVFTEAEANTIAPRCAALMPILRRAL